MGAPNHCRAVAAVTMLLRRSLGISPRQMTVRAASQQAVSLANPHPPSAVDAFFHLGLTSADDVKERFGDVRFFCTGGSAGRIRAFAKKAAKELRDASGNPFIP